MLAIAAPSFNAPSETFIRDHVRHIAPGGAILLCQDRTETDKLGCPVLSDLDIYRPWHNLRERVANHLRFRYQRHIDPGLRRPDRHRVREFFANYKPTACLAEYGPMGCLVERACAENDVPLYVHFHGYDATILPQSAHHRRHYRKLFRSAAGVIAPSRYLVQKLADLGCPKEKLHVSSCGVDPSRFLPTTGHSTQLIAAVGRLVEKKAPHLTIEAFARIKSRFPDARLEMVGDGPLAETCHQTVNRHALQDSVTMHGVRDPAFVSALMQRASLFAQHSVIARNGDSEGLPVAILEAMTSALPIVATRHSGIPEAVSDSETGLLVDEHDTEGMAAAVARLLGEPDLAARMGAAGRQRVLDNFTHQHTRDRLRAIMGLPPMTAEQIQFAWAKQQVLEACMR